MQYRLLDLFVRPARARAEYWRSALGVVAIAALYFGGTWLALMLVAQVVSPMQFLGILRKIATGSTPEGLIMLLSTFAPLAMATSFVLRWLHQRNYRTLFGQGWTRDFLRVLVPLVAFQLALFPLALLNPDVGRSTPLATVLAWFPVLLGFLMLQVTAEEMVFRGYLLQQLGARSRHPTVWMLAPSILFGVLHFNPADFGGNAIYPAIWAMIFGCLAADLTARTGNLGAALAFHFVINLSGMVLVGLYGTLDGLALFTLVINTRDFSQVLPYLATDLLSMLVSWLIARLVLRV
ncbi:CPBP family intramembrane metalloprotease [Pseudothioclava arenosa]|uniref:CPBP family intramembrane metalloprotease n=1 Tax=Pseudothioclava arenosa TaxID=1795308 RepID=A0A2A4CQ54_9RHOB|nr:CPBP family intramembrane metalloprotease [Pseudothioclava arenosa]